MIEGFCNPNIYNALYFLNCAESSHLVINLPYPGTFSVSLILSLHFSLRLSPGLIHGRNSALKTHA